MEFYKIWVSAINLHGKEPLTYSSSKKLAIGEIVSINLRNKKCLGIVKATSTKPKFKTKDIETIENRPKTTKQNLLLLDWIINYYPAPIGQIASLFIPSNLNTKPRNTVPDVKISSSYPLPNLTKEQVNALKQIESSENKPVILHGDTGSGKTRIYLELTKHAISKNKSAIILTPEIGLTPQLAKSFEEIFTDKVIVTHSELTPAQKRDIWIRVSTSSEPLVIIGPRSALFLPLINIGIIVVDEFHDSAYKQEQAPHYLASRVASKLANLHNAKLILGSATPNVSDYFIFETKNLPIVRMETLAVNQEKSSTEIEIIEINDRSKFSKSAWLSDSLINSMRNSFNAGQQSLLFLNRRGSARVALCQKCRWQALCTKCDIPMTYHGDSHILRCHTCGLKSKAPTSCPDCGAIEIEFKGIGTKALLNEVIKNFPEARIARFDSDNLKSESLNSRFEDIKNGEIDILVGTQTLTKGLDLPNLTTVGVVTADTALFFPDYTAEEVSYQQLQQVIGRVGRGHNHGKVVIQTYYSENSSIKATVDKNYSLFYKQQLSERKKFHFPPYFYTLKITCSRKSDKSAESFIRKLNKLILDLPLSIEIIGPSPSFKQKQNDMYFWQLVVKTKKREHLTTIVNTLPGQFSYDLDPINLL